MILEFLYLALGLIGLYFGAEWLVGGSSKLALRFGVAPLVIGLTVVAFGTSAPELAVCLQLNYAGNPDAAVGNVVGSNICNILLILGISALIMPLAIKSQVVRREMPILIVVSLVLVWILHDNYISQLEGVGLFVGIVVYVWLSFTLVKRSPAPEVEEEFAAEFGDSKKAHSTPGIVLAASACLLSARLSSRSAVSAWRSGSVSARPSSVLRCSLSVPPSRSSPLRWSPASSGKGTSSPAMPWARRCSTSSPFSALRPPSSRWR